jgi:hypothetical protein
MNSYASSNNESTYIIKKINEAKEQMLSESFDNIDDATVSRFMLYSALKQELSGEEGENK